ncbi:MAG TPA: hypothetical protein VK846_13030, partial [Candidatus Limnocylindria bacterium]|nr:hypothetical protein [Candidatus Limnocylindria bacterium]
IYPRVNEHARSIETKESESSEPPQGPITVGIWVQELDDTQMDQPASGGKRMDALEQTAL